MTDYTRDYGTEEDMVAQKISPEAKEMVKWFLQNYEDPVENCPHDSEDGFEFVFGGPYSAVDELTSQYGDSSEQTEFFIEEAAKYLDEMCIEWSAMPKDEDDSIPDTEDLMDTEDLWGEE